MTAAGEVLAALVAIDPRAAHAWPFLLGIAYAQPGTIVVGLDGTTLRIREDGGADPVLAGGHPHGGAAFDPMNTRRGARP